MSKKRENIIPNTKDWPIYKVYSNRDGLVKEMNEYVFQRLVNHFSDLDSILSKTVYLEKQRVKKDPWKVDPADDKSYWYNIGKELKESGIKEDKVEIHRQILKRIINRYNEEIVGTFNEKTYRFSKKFVAGIFRRLLNTASGRNHRRFWGNKKQLFDKIKVTGHSETVRSLFEQGTVVVVPTHFSNLDSIMIGWALDEIVGLPAFAFGAGLNLFDVELVGYFINRLGAYRVDRRKKNPIYLQCLKAMTTLSLNKGLNNIFFPGGTRSRSGAIEDHLKLGLLGSVVESQRMTLEQGKKEKIFIVPLVVGYHFVLEAKHLIDQQLQKEGKEKYIRTKDQYKSYRKLFKFVWSLFSKKSEIVLSFGEPLDVLGNKVNENGESRDERGDIIDISDYFKSEGQIVSNRQRETVYTKLLGEHIVHSYQKNNVVLTSHLVAFIAFNYFRNQFSDLEFYTFLNLGVEELSLEKNILVELVDIYKSKLQTMSDLDKLKLSDQIHLSAEEIIDDGVENLGIYHAEKPLYIKKDDHLGTMDLKLLYFYHNRLINYDLESIISWPTLENPQIEYENVDF